MTDRNKNPLSELQKLQAEKQRLKAICEMKEEKLRSHYEELRHNYLRMAMYSVLPFEKNTTEKVLHFVNLANKHVLPRIFGISFGRGTRGWKENLVRLSQAAMIAVTFTLLKKIFGRKAEKFDKE